MFKWIVASGFAMFSMFFGSGNLVFPLSLGVASSPYFFLPTFGLFLTAVCVPFLGLVALTLYKGDYELFFKPLGPQVRFFLILIMLCLMGPFGIIPRCAWVAYSGLSVIKIPISFEIFGILFFALVGLCAWQKDKVMDIIAFILSPFKFGSIALLLTQGLLFAKKSFSAPALAINPQEMFNEGLYSGYQTMDLLAAFFFSSIIYDFLKQKAPKGNDKKLFKLSIGSSILGGGILALVYTSLVLLGSLYATKLQGIEPQNMLATISQEVLGEYGLWLVSFILIISCLTTSTVLTKLFSEFLKRDVFKDKASYVLCLKATLVIAFVLSLTGFQAICKVLGTVLGWSYPLLIVYTIFRIFQKRHDFR